jgi:hypothetical protein
VDLASPVEFVGPFEHHEVTVNGWTVPYLTATPLPGGRVDLTLDHRYMLDLSLQEAERLVPFLANAIAIAHGYTAHPSDDEDEPLAPTKRHPMARLSSLGPDPDAV